jgi:hypothetical protein
LTTPEEPGISRRSPMGIVRGSPDVKFVQTRRYAKAEDAAARLLEIAAEVGPNAMGWYYVEKINAQFLYKDGGSPAEYVTGIAFLRAGGRILMHDSGSYFTMPI